MEETVTFAKEDVAAIDGTQGAADVAVVEEKEAVSDVSEEKGNGLDKDPVVVVEDEKASDKTEVVEDKKNDSDPTGDRIKAFEEQWSKKFSALSRRERHLSQKERESNDRGRSSDSDRKEIDELKAFKKEFESNPYGMMDKAGHTYENWTQKILAGEPVPVPSQTPKELESIREELNQFKEERKKQGEQQVIAQRQQVYQTQMSEISKVISEKTDDYPLINVFGDEQLVFDIRAEKFKQDVNEYDKEYAMENLMSIEDAAKHAEDWRESVLREKKIAIDPFKKKLGNIFAVSEPTEEEKEKAALKEVEDKEGTASESSQTQGTGSLPEKTRLLLGAKSRAKTLTNEQQTTVPARENRPFKSEQERIDHAAQFLRHN